MRVAVTGADGFIGQWLVRELLVGGHSVTGIVRRSRLVSTGDAYREIVCDLTEYAALGDLLRKAGVEAFVNLAWDGIEGAAFLDYRAQLANAVSVADAVTACAEAGVRRFVQVGSINQYEVLSIDATPVVPRMANNYSVAKLAAEHMGRALAGRSGMSFSGARLAMTYGAGNRSAMLPNVVIRQLLARQVPSLIDGLGPYDLIHVSEAVGGLRAIVERGVDQQTYYVGHEEVRTFRQILTRMRDELAPEVPLNFGAYPEQNHIDFGLIDTIALRRDTGYRCEADFGETLRHTADWLAAEAERDAYV